jgi:membrane-bound ClpP family serine protease
MSILSIILIIFVGVVLLLLELLVLPGITFAGIVSFLALAAGVFCGYYFHDAQTGNIILATTILIMIIGLVVTFKFKTWQRFSLNATIDSKVNIDAGSAISIGDEGVTISKLSPIGKAMIADKTYEVSSKGNYINSNVKVKIVNIEGNKIIVETKN